MPSVVQSKSIRYPNGHTSLSLALSTTVLLERDFLLCSNERISLIVYRTSKNTLHEFVQAEDFMAAKRQRSISAEETATSAEANTTESKTCVICSDKARYNNYGTLSCQSCKTFFRRNGYRPETVRPCTLNGSCEVNMQTRHNCTACRLAKCMAMGMSPDLIRKEDCKKRKQTTATENQQPTVDMTLQIPSGDQSLLSESQWTLLSNIVHAYDAYDAISRVQEAVRSLPTLSGDVTPKVISPVEIIDQMCTSMQLFISSSPDFRVLTRNEQASLLDRNLFGVVGLYSTYVFRQTDLLNITHFFDAFTTIYGTDVMLSMKQATEQLDPDATVIKIVLITCAFSSSCLLANPSSRQRNDSLLHGTFRLMGSHDVYVELLWKYLLYQYGYQQAALRLTRLTQIFLCVLKNLATLYSSNETHRQISNQATEKTKQMLVTIEQEQTLLWGKTLTT